MEKRITYIITIYKAKEHELLYWNDLTEKLLSFSEVHVILDNPNFNINGYFENAKIFKNEFNKGQFASVFTHIKNGNVKTEYFKVVDPDDYISVKNARNLVLPKEPTIINFTECTTSPNKILNQEQVEEIIENSNKTNMRYFTFSNTNTILPTKPVYDSDFELKEDMKINCSQDQLLGAIAYSMNKNIIWIDYPFYLYSLNAGVTNIDNTLQIINDSKETWTYINNLSLKKNIKFNLLAHNTINWFNARVKEASNSKQINQIESSLIELLSIPIFKDDENFKKISFAIPFHKQEIKFLNKLIEYANKHNDYIFHIAYTSIDEDFFSERPFPKNIILTKCKLGMKKNAKLFEISKKINSDYVVVLDPDDEIDFDKIESFQNEISNSNSKVIINSFYRYNESSDSIVETTGCNQKVGTFDMFKKIDHEHPLHNAAVTYSLETFKSALLNLDKFHDEIMGQDLILLCSATHNLNKSEILFLNSPFYIYKIYDLEKTNSYHTINLVNFENYKLNILALRKIIIFKNSPFYSLAIRMIISDIFTISSIDGYIKHTINFFKFKKIYNEYFKIDEFKIEIKSSEWNFERVINISENSIEFNSKKDLGLSIVFTLFNETEDEIEEIASKIYTSNFHETFIFIDKNVSIEMLNRLSFKFPEIEFFSNLKNLGKSGTNYNSSDLTFKKWIKFIDPDDDLLINKSTINKFNIFAKELNNSKEKISIILHKFTFETPIGNDGTFVFSRNHKLYENTAIYKKDHIEIKNIKILPFNANKIYSSVELSNVPLLQRIYLNMHEDVLMTSQLSMDDTAIAYFDKNLYKYYYGVGITNEQLSEKSTNEISTVTKSYIDNIDRYPAIYQNELLHHNYDYSVYSKDKLKSEEIIEKLNINKNVDELNFLKERIDYKQLKNDLILEKKFNVIFSEYKIFNIDFLLKVVNFFEYVNCSDFDRMIESVQMMVNFEIPKAKLLNPFSKKWQVWLIGDYVIKYFNKNVKNFNQSDLINNEIAILDSMNRQYFLTEYSIIYNFIKGKTINNFEIDKLLIDKICDNILNFRNKKVNNKKSSFMELLPTENLAINELCIKKDYFDLAKEIASNLDKNCKFVPSHGDLNQRNIIITTDDNIEFIDFELSMFMPDLWDLASFISHTNLPDELQNYFYKKFDIDYELRNESLFVFLFIDAVWNIYNGKIEDDLNKIKYGNKQMKKMIAKFNEISIS